VSPTRTLVAVTATATAAVLVTASAAHAATVLSVGHVDVVDAGYVDGELEIAVFDEDNEVEYDPADVVFAALPGSAVAVPDDPAYAFLGTSGTTVWVLPEVQDPDLLWPGIAAEEVEPGVFVNDRLSLRILKVKGPDGLSVFRTGSAGEPIVLADSEDGLPDAIPLTAGLDEHANWAFEAPGTYQVTVRVTGRLAATGEVVRSDREVLTFTVEA
jgi:surface-anchored protein